MSQWTQNKSFHSFQKWGRQGGLKRARSISSHLRKSIATRAAQARWKNKNSLLLKSIRLENPQWCDSVFIEEILSEGTVEQWKEIYHKIANHPFGSTAQSLEKVLNSSEMYGISPLWKGLLRGVRGYEK